MSSKIITFVRLGLIIGALKYYLTVTKGIILVKQIPFILLFCQNVLKPFNKIIMHVSSERNHMLKNKGSKQQITS